MRLARLITFAATAAAAVLWCLMLVTWYRTDPGFEPLHVGATALLTTLVALLSWLRERSGRQDELVKSTPSSPPLPTEPSKASRDNAYPSQRRPHDEDAHLDQVNRRRRPAKGSMMDRADPVPLPALGQGSLVEKYFGRHLQLLSRAREAGGLPRGRFVRVASSPAQLESTLREIEPLGLTQSILSEFRHIRDAKHLDARLMAAWAELRTVLQLKREGFSDIKKVGMAADLTATRGGRRYAFQATRRPFTLPDHVEYANRRAIEDGKQATATNLALSGRLVAEMHRQLDKPLFCFFARSVEKKNDNLCKWPAEGWIRCIVIITRDPHLQNPMFRYFACQQIAKLMHHFEPRHFEEILWLPDMGHGAWFRFARQSGETICMTDWTSAPDQPVERSECDLKSPVCPEENDSQSTPGAFSPHGEGTTTGVGEKHIPTRQTSKNHG